MGTKRTRKRERGGNVYTEIKRMTRDPVGVFLWNVKNYAKSVKRRACVD